MATNIDPTTGLTITNVTPQAIPTSSLQGATPLQIPPVEDVTPTYLSAINNSALQSQNDVTTQQANVDNITSQYQGLGDTYTTLLGQSQGKEADRTQAYRQTGATDLLNQVNDYNTQLANLSREATAIPLQLGQEYKGFAGAGAEMQEH